MQRMVTYIERLEEHLLRWLRLVTVVVVTLVIFGSILTFLVSLMNIAASTEVEVGSLDDVAFAEPSVRNMEASIEEEPKDQPQRQTTQSANDGPYGSQVAQTVSTLRPLMDTLESEAVSARAIKSYVEDRIDDLADTISGTLGLRGSDATSRLDAAVDGMVDYTDDLVDYYGDEIDLEISDGVGLAGKKIHPQFEAHLKGVLRAPLHDYVSTFQDHAKAAAAIAQREAAEGRESVESGLAGMKSLPMMGALGLALLFLLLLFKIEIRLSEHDIQVKSDSEDGQGAQEATT